MVNYKTNGAKLMSSILKKGGALLLTGALWATSGSAQLDSVLNISGSVDVYFRQNLTAPNHDDNGGRIAPGTSFANGAGFSLGMANLVLAKEWKNVGFNADLVFGPRGDEAVFGSIGNPAILNQLYVYWNASEKLTFTLGNFNTFLGYEVISPTANFNYSTSYMFSYGPFSHSGLKLDYAIGEKLSVMGAILNPTDVTEMNNVNSYSAGFQLGYESDKGGAWFNVLYGDQDGTPELASGDTDLTAAAMLQFDLTTGWNLTEKAYVGLNATHNNMPNHISTIDASTFMGGALYLQYAFSDAVSLGIRGEYFAETMGGAGAIGGYDTNGDASIIDLTLSGRISKGDLTFIPEVRFDTASENIFIDQSDNPTNSLASFVLAGVYSF